jgi:hypothetical protein
MSWLNSDVLDNRRSRSNSGPYKNAVRCTGEDSFELATRLVLAEKPRLYRLVSDSIWDWRNGITRCRYGTKKFMLG